MAHVDIVIIKENKEGEYSGLAHEVVPSVFKSLKVITKFCTKCIAKYAFEYAYLHNRKTMTAMHKGNIMKLAYGLFLESCYEVAPELCLEVMFMQKMLFLSKECLLGMLEMNKYYCRRRQTQ